jgi:TolA-binding protein
MKQIVPNDNCLTPEKILRYLQDESSPAEMRAIDRHLDDCPMCSDAIEGAMALPISQLKESFTNIQAKISTESDLKVVEKPLIKPIMQVVHRNTKRYWLMGAAASVALLVAAGVWFFQGKTAETKAVAVVENKMEMPASTISMDTTAVANYAVVDDVKTDFKIEGNSTVNAPKSSNKPSNTIVSTPTSDIKTTEIPPNTVASAPSAEYSLARKIPESTVEKTDNDTKAIVAEMERQKQNDNESISVLKDKTAVSQSEQAFDISNNAQYKTADTNKNSRIVTASAPNAAPNQNNYPGAATQNVAIPDVQRAGAEYSMAKKKAQKVEAAKPIQNYLVSGINFYNTKMYDLAIGDFNRLIAVEKTGDNYETALWYLANSYLKKGDKVTAKKLLTRLVAQKGKFLEEANALLKE